MKEEFLIAVFLKDPREVPVKTRLGLPGRKALELATRLAVYTFEKLKKFPLAVWCYPAKDTPFVKSSQEKYQFSSYTQVEGDLGKKMEASAREHLRNYKKVILVGTDCPDLGEAHIQQVLTKLDSRPFVFIPAHDGGYVLLAMREKLPPVFKGIPWGTGDVLKKSLALLPQEEVWVLESLPDLDRPEDLPDFQKRYPFLFAEQAVNFSDKN